MSDENDVEGQQALRVDKWLWHARFLKSRSLAAKLVTEGKLRINGNRYTKPGKTVRAEDVLTFRLHENIKIVKIVALGTRRGPAPEAQALYEDMSPPAEPRQRQADVMRERWGGDRRPNKPKFDSA